MAKRTYSSRYRPSSAPQDFQRKRSKLVDDDELRLPGDLPRHRPQQPTSSTSKKTKFGGPVSFDDEDGGIVDSEDSSLKPSTSNLSVFDKALNGKLKSVKPRQPNIHGSREDFEKTMNDPGRTKKSNAGATRNYLPTPPSDVESQQTKNLNRMFPGLGGRGSGVLDGSKAGVKLKQSMSVFDLEDESESESSVEVTKDEEPKEPYVPKQYEAENTPAPRRDICGNRLSSKSELAALWTANQANSPFLRLPNEVRTRIYDLALADKTIKIGYQTWRIESWDADPVPVFKYHCTVINKTPTNPFLKDSFIAAKYDLSHTFTPLGNICRQLYLETAHLPFASGLIAFESHRIMTNFILHDKRLSSKQRQAITTLVLPDNLPGGNMLAHLPNVQRVYLAFNQVQKPKGWYEVVREQGKKPYLVDKWGYAVEEL